MVAYIPLVLNGVIQSYVEQIECLGMMLVSARAFKCLVTYIKLIVSGDFSYNTQ